jgi:hypothetical protein
LYQRAGLFVAPLQILPHLGRIALSRLSGIDGAAAAGATCVMALVRRR